MLIFCGFSRPNLHTRQNAKIAETLGITGLQRFCSWLRGKDLRVCFASAGLRCLSAGSLTTRLLERPPDVLPSRRGLFRFKSSPSISKNIKNGSVATVLIFLVAETGRVFSAVQLYQGFRRFHAASSPYFSPLFCFYTVFLLLCINLNDRSLLSKMCIRTLNYTITHVSSSYYSSVKDVIAMPLVKSNDPTTLTPPP